MTMTEKAAISGSGKTLVLFPSTTHSRSPRRESAAGDEHDAGHRLRYQVVLEPVVEILVSRSCRGAAVVQFIRDKELL
jgi:hypothetical protein